MGITSFSLQLLRKHSLLQVGTTMLELGCQNLYNARDYGDVARPYFESLGLTVRSIDITGCHDTEMLDLTKPFDVGQYDLVTDFGTTEHVAPDGLWQARANVHNACKVGGIMVHENPKTGNWPGHGNHYMTQAFYETMAHIQWYEILDLGEHPAMGNDVDGWNIYCVMRKVKKGLFMTKGNFDKLPFHST